MWTRVARRGQLQVTLADGAASTAARHVAAGGVVLAAIDSPTASMHKYLSRARSRCARIGCAAGTGGRPGGSAEPWRRGSCVGTPGSGVTSDGRGIVIIARTPLRISLMGGGTDFPRYYLEHGGAVLNAAIDKYMYVMVNTRFTPDVRVAYTRTEIVEHVEQLQHELIREAMRLTGATSQLDIATMSDIPAQGTGLGSSSAVTVGALNALHAYLGRHASAATLAEQACTIEIDILNRPIGKQDQYVAAYGGLRFTAFETSGDVIAEPIVCTPERRRELTANLQLFYTGVGRNSNTVLGEQDRRTDLNVPLLDRLAEMAGRMRDVIGGDDSLDEVGELLHESWQLKKQLAPGITSDRIDEYYDAARSAGAIGGKIAGAGGGGFLLLYCPKDRKGSVRAALSPLRETTFRFEPHGSQIVFVSD